MGAVVTTAVVTSQPSDPSVSKAAAWDIKALIIIIGTLWDIVGYI
jgi:hypothetical protein